MASVPRNILVTGGAGFIGQEVVEDLLRKPEEHRVIVLDLLTYAVSPAGFKAWRERLEQEYPGRCQFIHEDIANFDHAVTNFGSITGGVAKVAFEGRQDYGEAFLKHYHVDWIIHAAAETAEPRSRSDPHTVARTNGKGTTGLVITAFLRWQEMIGEWHRLPEGEEKDRLAEQIRNFRFLFISTDKVVGEVKKNAPKHTEEAPYNPGSFYAETKKMGEVLGLALHGTTDPAVLEKQKDSYEPGSARYKYYHDMPFSGFPFIVVRLENVIGKGQHEEKVLPRIIKQVFESIEREEIQENDKPYTVFGPEIIHSYMAKPDVSQGIIKGLEFGNPGQIYNLGAFCELPNLKFMQIIADTFQELSLENPLVVPPRRDGRPHNDPGLFRVGPAREADDEREALDPSLAMKSPEEGGIDYGPQYIGEEGIRRAVREVIIDEAVRWMSRKQTQLDAALAQVDLTAIMGDGNTGLYNSLC